MKRYWSPDEEARLKAMVADAASGSEIAAAIGRSRGSISGKLARLGLVIHPEAAERAYRAALAGRRSYKRPLGIRQSDETRAKRSASMKATIATYSPEKLEHLQNCRRRVRSAAERAKISRSKLPDIPEYMIPDYRMLVYKKGYLRAEALEILRADIARLKGSPDLARADDARRGSATLLERLLVVQRGQA